MASKHKECAFLALRGFICYLSYWKSGFFTQSRNTTERYRSGHNGDDSKSSVRPKGVPWVRIPPSPPFILLTVLDLKVYKSEPILNMFQERCPSGRRGTIGNRVCVNSAPRVRIPPSPPQPGYPLIAGSCATKSREPRQVRKEATVVGPFVCRRGAWLSSFFLSIPCLT